MYVEKSLGVAVEKRNISEVRYQDARSRTFLTSYRESNPDKAATIPTPCGEGAGN